MMPAILIGRNPDCDLVLDQPQVSRRHARLSQVSDHVWLIEDLDSTGGTWVNGRRVKRAAVSTTDEVNCAGVSLPLKPIFDASSTAKNTPPAPAGFITLEAVYETYESTRLRIQRNDQLKKTALRAGLSLIPFVGNAIGILASTQLGAQEQLAALDKEFKISYVCPSCKSFLGFTPWQGLVNMGSCARCRKPWSEL